MSTFHANTPTSTPTSTPTPARREVPLRRICHSLAISAVLLITASCAGTSDADPAADPSDASATLAADTDSNSDARTAITTTTTTTTTTTAPTAPTTRAPAATTSTTTLAPTTTLSPADTFLDQTCETLSTAGYETRKAALAGAAAGYVAAAGGDDDALAALQTLCGEPLTRLQEAMEIEARSAALNLDNEGAESGDQIESISMDNFVCGESKYVGIEVTNNTDHPIGIHVKFTLSSQEAAIPYTTSQQPIVVWSIEPGATRLAEGSIVPTAGAYHCDGSIYQFDATQTTADASLGTTQYPELTGDDPALWFPALLAFGLDSTGSGDLDRAAVSEDVRSIHYSTVLENVQTGEPLAPEERPTYTLCERGQTSPDADHLSLIFFAEYPERTVEADDGIEVRPAHAELQHGLFRRGNDGQWRWLSTSQYFDSSEYYEDCGTPVRADG